MKKPGAVYLLTDRNVAYSPETQRQLAELLDVLPVSMTGDEAPSRLGELRDAQIVLSGWGAPRLDDEFLKAMPGLAGVFYAAGSIRGLVTEEFWARGIPICSAASANAVPVAEFSLAQIILCQKDTFRRSRVTHAAKSYVSIADPPGNYRTRVGIIGLGVIGRLVVEMLKVLNVEIWASDPIMSDAAAAQLGVHLTDLDSLFRECDVVSLHAPNLPNTCGMITGAHFQSMKMQASFVNTARGALVRETEMIEALQARPDLFAALDVTDPEPPRAGSPLYTLPNVFLTPHIAGSMGRECWRMGEYMAQDVERFLAGAPLQWQITQEMARTMA